MSEELGWMIVEMLGHRVLAGFVSEVEIAGAGFLRVDLWSEEGSPKTTQFIAPASIYALTPTTEEAVRERMKPRIVHRWELPAHEEDQQEDEFTDPFREDETPGTCFDPAYSQ